MRALAVAFAIGAASQAAALRRHGQPWARLSTRRPIPTQARRLQAEAACAASPTRRGIPCHCANAIHGRARRSRSPPSPFGPAPTRPNVLRRVARAKAARRVRFAIAAFACSTLTIRTIHLRAGRETRKTRRAMPPSERRRTTEVPATAPAVFTTTRQRPTPARRRRLRPMTQPRARRRPLPKGMHPRRARHPTPLRRAQPLHLQARPR